MVMGDGETWCESLDDRVLTILLHGVFFWESLAHHDWLIPRPAQSSTNSVIMLLYRELPRLGRLVKVKYAIIRIEEPPTHDTES